MSRLASPKPPRCQTAAWVHPSAAAKASVDTGPSRASSQRTFAGVQPPVFGCCPVEAAASARLWAAKASSVMARQARVSLSHSASG
jgi:hypothetical protein